MKKFKPITKSRIEVVDALRGFALMGVLFANVPIGGKYLATGIFDELISFLTDLLISQKFITIFSILFGFGFYSQVSRAVCSQIKMNFFAQNLREVSANLVKNFDTVFF